jgi:NitT/TauT family transport system substrate-binding protein
VPIQRRRRFLTDAPFARAAGLSGFGASGKSRAAALQTRRGFLRTAAFAGVAGMLPPLGARAAEPGPETTTITLPIATAICTMPQMITRQLLQAEGFTDIRFVDEPEFPANAAEQLARGDVDLMVNYASNFIIALDEGEATTLLAGVHGGCFVLFGPEDVHGIAGLKGRTVAVPGFGSGPDLLLSLMAAEVGLDPKKDLRWIADPKANPKALFIAGKVDAFLGFPPEPQELRTRHIGRVIFDTAVDRPWSQYFCCMLAGNPEFVRRHPVATKRAMRAILKATDLCASVPASAARLLVDGRFTSRYDYALQTLRDVRYDTWREYDAEDAVRFYALRMREAGFIKSTPQKIIAENTDWRFLDELKRELKA